MSRTPETETQTPRHAQIAALYCARAAGLQSSLTRQLGNPQLAEEALATAWERLLRRPDIDLSQGTGWLYVVARNEGLHLCRQAARTTSIDLPVGDTGTETIVDLVSGRDDPPDRVEQYDRLSELHQLLPAQREALLLQAAGFSYDEIAQRTAASHTTVRKRLAKARAHLRTHERLRQHHERRTPTPDAPDLDETPPTNAPGTDLQRRLARIAARQHNHSPQLRMEIDR